jgi:hypothetical protein
VGLTGVGAQRGRKHTIFSPSSSISLASASALPSSSSSQQQINNRKPEELDAVANELLSEFVMKKPNKNGSKSEETTAPAPISLSPLSSSSSSSTHSSRSSSASSSSSSSDENNPNDVIDDLLDDNDEVNGNGKKNNNNKKNKASSSVSNKSGTLIIRRDTNTNLNNESPSPPLPSASNQVNSRLNQLKNAEPTSVNTTNTQLQDVSNSSSFANITDEHHNQIVNTVGLGVGSGVGLGAIMQPSSNVESQFRKNVTYLEKENLIGFL